MPRISDMNRNRLFLLLLPLVLTVCASPPKAVEIPHEEPVAVTTDISEPDKAEASVTEEDSVRITQEIYDQTLAEVKVFIENLNKVIISKNYNAWKNTLSDEYFTEISSPEFLKKASEMPSLKSRGIVLKTPDGYFTNVVVPSRANSRVDEIEFIDTNRVKAYFLDKDKGRLRVYDLIKIGDEWKIIN